MNLSLEGKYAIICGSTQGIGLAIAKELALLGSHCTLVARNEDALKTAIHHFDIALRQQHNYLVADFTKPGELKKVINAYVVNHPVHILINNTGGPKPGSIIEASEQDFINAFNQHIICNQVLMQAVVPLMKKEGYGRIINVISTSVRIPIHHLGVSNTIRAAVASWAKTISNELGQFNITVNNILPGFTNTQRLRSLIEVTAHKKGLSIEAVEKEMIESIPVKRFADASEIAAVAAFLASPAAAYVNGVSIPVDGGRTGTI
jgi:3-oxoacyl-[acyl-carrier protein] reductase